MGAVPACKSVYLMCTVPMEARGRLLISWNLGYWWSLENFWVLGMLETSAGSSAKAATALSC